jgi:PAS domain S-box-containing protein
LLPGRRKVEASFTEHGRQRQSARRVAVAVTTMFAIGGTAWVLITDLLLYAFIDDRAMIARLETAKGWIFIGIGCALVYTVARRSAAGVIRARFVVAAVVDSIADGVLLLGPRRTIVYANPAAVRMLGCASADDLLGMGAIEFSRRFRVSYPNGALVAPEQFVSQRAFDEDGPLHYKATMHPMHGGRELVISATAAAVREYAGEHPGMVVSVMHDITDSDHLERLRDQFFAAAAHALKTPVAVIKAHVQLISREAAPQLRRSTAAVERQCDRIDRLVQNLLVLSRVRSRSLQLHKSEVDLASLVRKAAREVAHDALQRDVHVAIEACPRVLADAERLVLGLTDVIDEACRSSVAGSTLQLLLACSDGNARIDVRYFALPPEERPLETYGEYDDIGIGRCVAATIIEAHGGSLCEQTSGQETIATIRLPASEGANGRA